MASCSPSASSARAALAAMALAASAIPAHGQTAPSPPARTETQDPLERLRAARAGQVDQGVARGPAALPTPSPQDARRAFESLRRHAPRPDMQARARVAHDKAGAAFAAERDAMARRLGQALGLETPDMAAIARVAAPPLAASWVPVLFVSSAMPTAILRSYAAQLERARGVLAFRGMPGGLHKVAPMARLSAEILRLDPGCEGPACAMRDVQVIVDPLLFRQHGVARVPALTMVPGDPTQPYCEREEASPTGRHLVLGDAALTGLLEEYARLGGKEEAGDAAARIQNYP